jgi:hypothetical protein
MVVNVTVRPELEYSSTFTFAVDPAVPAVLGADVVGLMNGDFDAVA